MVKEVIYGTEDGMNYYVQTCCGEEHLGQDCDCREYGVNLVKEDAKILADKLSKDFKVSCREII